VSLRNRFAEQERASLRVDFEADGASLDDVAIGGEHIHLLRLEDMGEGSFWGRITLKDGRALVLSFYAEKKGVLSATAEWE
jgi:hypothetical protein